MEEDSWQLPRDDRPEPPAATGPEWFQRAVAETPSSHHVTVADCDIHYLRWGPEAGARPGILFIHGGAAHARWWSFIAPFFAEDRPVAAIDLSGMGDSGHRESYENEFHVAEIAAVLEDARLGEKPIIVGHSFGGYMTMSFTGRHGDEISGAVIIDSALRPEEEEREPPGEGFARPKPYFPNQDIIVRRFRLRPAQSCENKYLVDFIARHSALQDEKGWTWKHDVAERGGKYRAEPLADYLKEMPCRKALIYGAESVLVTPEVLEYMTGLYGPNDPIVCIPDAQHHLMLDQPLAFVDALRSILAGWDM